MVHCVVISCGIIITELIKCREDEQIRAHNGPFLSILEYLPILSKEQPLQRRSNNYAITIAALAGAH